jgi:hypothetical protein
LAAKEESQKVEDPVADLVTVPDANENSARPLAAYDIGNIEEAGGTRADLVLQDDAENGLEKQVMNVAYNVEPLAPSIKSSSRSSGVPVFALNRPPPPVLRTVSPDSSFADESFKLEETLIESISVHSLVNLGMNQRSSIKIGQREPRQKMSI